MNNKESHRYENNGGGVIMPDGSRISYHRAALYLGMPEGEIRAYAHAGKRRWQDLMRIRDGRGRWNTSWVDNALDRMDPEEVYTLGSYSRGQSDHWDILTELLGLDKAYAGKVRERWPDA